MSKEFFPKLYHSQSLESLAEALATLIISLQDSDPSFLFSRHIVLVPNPNVAEWLKIFLARKMGALSGVEFVKLLPFIGDWIEEELPGKRLGRREDIFFSLLGILLSHAWQESDILNKALSEILGSSNEDDYIRKVIGLADEMSRLFEEYSFSRGELLSLWENKEKRYENQGDWSGIEEWQRILWTLVSKKVHI